MPVRMITINELVIRATQFPITSFHEGPLECVYMISASLRGPDAQDSESQQLKELYVMPLRAWFYGTKTEKYTRAPALSRENIDRLYADVQGQATSVYREMSYDNSPEEALRASRRHFLAHLVYAYEGVIWLTGWGTEANLATARVRYGRPDVHAWEIAPLPAQALTDCPVGDDAPAGNSTDAL